MKEISNLFESLYSHFILRDVAAKSLPGSISLVALMGIIGSDPFYLFQQLVEQSILIASVVVFGLGLMFGMLFQTVASRMDLIVVHVWKNQEGIYDERLSLKQARSFLEVTENQLALSRKRERLVVLKEMAGNYSVSFLLIFIYLLLQLPEPKPPEEGWRLISAATASIFIWIALLWQNRVQAEEQRDWEEIIVGPHLPSENLTDIAA